MKLTDVTADTEPWTLLNVCAHCSARRSWTACKRRSMRINQCIAMKRKDQNGCLFLHSSFFVSCKCLHLVWTEQNARTHTKYNGCGSGGVILFSFSSLFFFSSRIFFILYLSESKYIRTYTTDMIEYTHNTLYYIHVYIHIYII